MRHLSEGGVGLLSPAGAVSFFRPELGQVVDKDWNSVVAPIVHNAKATVIPVKFGAKNSKLFIRAGEEKQTALLIREFLKKKDKVLPIEVGEPIPYSRLKSLKDDQELTDYLRAHTYILDAARSARESVAEAPSEPIRSSRRLEPIRAPVDPDLLEAGIRSLPASQVISDSKESLTVVVEGNQMPGLRIKP
mgnify:CR=1 FL=1